MVQGLGIGFSGAWFSLSWQPSHSGALRRVDQVSGLNVGLLRAVLEEQSGSTSLEKE